MRFALQYGLDDVTTGCGVVIPSVKITLLYFSLTTLQMAWGFGDDMINTVFDMVS